jgi:hypothetical protein
LGSRGLKQFQSDRTRKKGKPQRGILDNRGFTTPPIINEYEKEYPYYINEITMAFPFWKRVDYLL